MVEINKKYNWSKWLKFPDPRKGEYLTAPFGLGVYQLRNSKTGEYILFGTGSNLAYRMSSLLPKPFGQGTRKNENKRQYVLENISNIKYRTTSFLQFSEMKKCETELKKLNVHKFNT